MSNINRALHDLAEKQKRNGDWYSFLECRRNLDHDRGVTALTEVPLDVSDAEYRVLVAKTWTWAHGIWENRESWRRILTGEHRPLGSFTNRADKARLETLSDPLVVYRGCTDHNQLGFSWTCDFDRAAGFAYMAQGWTKAEKRYVLSGRVKHCHVLAFITTRNEEEVVTLPEKVTDIVVQDISESPPMTESDLKKLGKASR